MRTSESDLSLVEATEAEGIGKTLESASRLGGFGFAPMSSAEPVCGDDTTKLRVLLADDHKGFRRILTSFLRSQIGVEVVGEAADGQDAIELTLQLRPDIVFIDMYTPTYDAMEATVIIKGKLPGTRVFVLSMDSSEQHLRVAERADGFIAKQTMKSAILKVLANERLREARITRLAS
jgi:DNA-binding NarL/FixJ family response regulator